MLLRRNAAYRPRPEPADFLAGGKAAKVDALDVRVVPDGGTAAALAAGEIDYVQYAPFDLLPRLERDRRLKVLNFTGPHMFTGHYRINTASKPFDDPAIRRVLLRLVDQREVLAGLGLGEKYSRACAAFFICGSPNESDAGTEALRDPSVEAAREALRRTSADRLRRAGFNVDLQVMDWASVLARRGQRQGWSVYGVHALGLDLSSPLTSFTAHNCTGAATSGYMCEERLAPLYEAFAEAPTPERRREVAGRIQAVVYEQGLGIPFGQ